MGVRRVQDGVQAEDAVTTGAQAPVGSLLAELTWSLVDRATDGRFTAAEARFLYATAAPEALHGRGARFTAGGAYTSGSSVLGWGLLINEREGTMTLTADQSVDAEGTFCGHCWVEVPDWAPVVVDAMTGYVGPRVAVDAGSRVAYVPRRSLANSVRKHHAEAMEAVRKAVRADKSYAEAVRQSLVRYEASL